MQKKRMSLFILVFLVIIFLSGFAYSIDLAGNLEDSISSYWSFDTADGSTNQKVVDLLNKNNGTVSGATMVDSCIKGQAFSFDGYNDFISIFNNYLMLFGYTSISAWVKFYDSQSGVVAGRVQVTDYRDGSDLFVVHKDAGVPNWGDKAIITGAGDIEIADICTLSSSCTAGVFTVYNGLDVVASVSESGNFCIEQGDCSVSSSCNSGVFTIRDDQGNIKASLSSTGDLCYTGDIIENGLN